MLRDFQTVATSALQGAPLFLCKVAVKLRSLTLCPLIPGSPGVPGNPRAPWDSKKDKTFDSSLLPLYEPWWAAPTWAPWWAAPTWAMICSPLTWGPAGPRSPALPGLPDSPWGQTGSRGNSHSRKNEANVLKRRSVTLWWYMSFVLKNSLQPPGCGSVTGHKIIGIGPQKQLIISVNDVLFGKWF